MTLFAFALVLTAAILHATWNFVSKRARNDNAFSFVFVLCSAVFFLPFAIGVLIWNQPQFRWETVGFLVVSGSLHILYYRLLSEGYRAGDLSLVYPLARGTGPVLAIFGAIVLFGERPSPLALAGAACVAGGIIVMTWVPHQMSGNMMRTSLFFAVATGAVTATYTLWDKQGVDTLTPFLYGYGLDVVRVALFAPLTLATSAGRESVRLIFRDHLRDAALVGILSGGAYMLVLAALSIAPVSYVAPAREVSILFGAIIGVRLLGEGNARRRLTGAVAIVAGVGALALG